MLHELAIHFTFSSDCLVYTIFYITLREKIDAKSLTNANFV